MIIEKIDPGRECFSDYSLEGTVLRVGGVTLDLADEEGDQQVVIPFGFCERQVHRGLMGKCCKYAAEIIIPPRRYETVEVEGAAGMFADEDNDDGIVATHLETTPAPLDTDSVILRIWPGSFEAGEEGKHGAE
jgi:hypothetical protein